MRKIYCDVCGNETSRYHTSSSRSFKKRSIFDFFMVGTDDVCHDCFDRIAKIVDREVEKIKEETKNEHI